MNILSQKVNDAITKLEKIDNPTLVKLINNSKSNYEVFLNCFKEKFLYDDTFFKQICACKLNTEERNKVIAEFLNVEEDRISLSPKLNDLLQTSYVLMQNDRLADLYENVRATSTMSISDFVVCWYIVNFNNELFYLMVDKDVDSNMFTEEVKVKYEKEKQLRKQSSSIMNMFKVDKDVS